MERKELDYWRLHDAMNLAQAAALITGNYPSDIINSEKDSEKPYLVQHDGENPGDSTEKNAQFNAVLSALTIAITRKLLPAQVAYRGKYHHIRYVGEEEEGYWEPIGDIDPIGTTVDVSDLRKWLTAKNLKPTYFFPTAPDAPDYLDPSNPRYAPKLAAAVRAWQAVTEPNGKHPKQALAKWLRENAAEFGLTDDEGKLNETGIEEVAKVANWQPGGGAPKTPGE